jgi:hypothetical protein
MKRVWYVLVRYDTCYGWHTTQEAAVRAAEEYVAQHGGHFKQQPDGDVLVFTYPEPTEAT